MCFKCNTMKSKSFATKIDFSQIIAYFIRSEIDNDNKRKLEGVICPWRILLLCKWHQLTNDFHWQSAFICNFATMSDND